MELLRRDASEMVRGAAAGLLSLVRLPFATDELAAALAGDEADPHPYPRSEAASALARHDGLVASTALVAALSDGEVVVRRAAIASLFRKASTYHGYDPEAPEAEREKAIRHWREWLRQLAE